MKILVVDDNNNDLELIAYELRGMGECTFARSRRELVGSLSEGPFDVALIDYWIPSLGWPDSMHLIHQKFPNCPVIVVSGAILEEVHGYETVRDGADDFVVKQRMSMLPHVIRRVIISRLAKAEREESLSRLNAMRSIDGIDGRDGRDGRDGTDGKDGKDGKPGTDWTMRADSS